jgi:hypothetical protein
MNAIPTLYKSIRFRSRLEARWAAFFDLIKWKWLYEPFDLKGYIPDFIVQFNQNRLLIEVKPLTGPNPKFHDVAQKIETSGWLLMNNGSKDLHSGASLIVGCGVNLDPKHNDCIYGKGRSPFSIDSAGWLEDFSYGVSGYGPCYIARCPHCHAYFYWNLETYWQCQHCLKETDKPYRLDQSDHPDLGKLLARAQNIVQWNPT